MREKGWILRKAIRRVLALVCANTSEEGQNGEGSWKEGVGSETDAELVSDSRKA